MTTSGKCKPGVMRNDSGFFFVLTAGRNPERRVEIVWYGFRPFHSGINSGDKGGTTGCTR